MAGRSDPAVAAAVGSRLGRIHAAFARDPAAPASFPRDDIFRAIRLEPYLEATGRAHPQLAGRLMALVERDRRDEAQRGAWRRQPQEHPDRPGGAGVPRCRMRLVRRPGLRSGLLPQPPAPEVPAPRRRVRRHISRPSTRCGPATSRAWTGRTRAGWRRAPPPCCPGLFLARIDGKSPVEYVTADADRNAVRRVAIPLIAAPPVRLAAVREAWAAELRARLRGPELEH